MNNIEMEVRRDFKIGSTVKHNQIFLPKANQKAIFNILLTNIHQIGVRGPDTYNFVALSVYSQQLIKIRT